jgi:hypothetical protein
MGLSRACFGLMVAGVGFGIGVLFQGHADNTALGVVLVCAGLIMGGVGYATRKA